MSEFMFATSRRDFALDFLRKEHPSRNLTDTNESAGPLLDLVEADIIRIQDPAYHQPSQVVPGTYWEESWRGEVVALCTALLRDAT